VDGDDRGQAGPRPPAEEELLVLELAGQGALGAGRPPEPSAGVAARVLVGHDGVVPSESGCC
jgi:hypothetical protein